MFGVPWKLIGYGIGALAFAGMLFFAYRWAYDNGVASQQPKIEALNNQAQQFQTANKDLNTQIDSIKAANHAFARKCAANSAKQASEIALLRKQKQQIRIVVQHEKSARQVIYQTHPRANRWQKTVVPSILAESYQQ